MKDKRNFFNNMNIRSKMVFIYIFCVLLPFVLVVVLYTLFANSAIEKQTLEMMSAQTVNYSQNINSRLMSFNTLGNVLANDLQLRETLEEKYDSVLDALPVYQDLWRQYALNRHSWVGLENVTIYTENETLHNSYPYVIRSDSYFQNMKEYQEILSVGSMGLWYGPKNNSSAEYWNPINQKESGTSSNLSYNRPIYSRNNISIPIGILTIEVRKDSLQELIYNKEDVSVFILNQLNTPVVSNGDWLADYGVSLDLEEQGEPQKIKTQNFYGYVDMDTLYNGWKILTCVSLSQAMQSASLVRVYGLTLILLISILALCMIFFFSKQIAQRFDRLLSKIKVFMREDMAIAEPLGGKDEIGLLDQDFTSLAKELKHKIDETYVLQLQKNQFHLQTLQMQINPHFLYNTLSTIAWLSDSSPREKIRGAVENLAAFYRVSLSKGRDIITLDEEIKGVTAYLEIQKLRYAGRIQVYYLIDTDLREAQIPKLTLQPLIENCIRHGIGGEKEQISIMIHANQQNGLVKITIQDDGIGMPSQELEQLQIGRTESKDGSGFGFKNVDERIKLYFGAAFGLQVTSTSNEGTKVTLSIPFKTGEEG